MKNVLIFLLNLFCVLSIWSQSDSLRDRHWLLGYSSGLPPDFHFGGSDLDFNQRPVAVNYEFRSLDFSRTNASICDKEGHLLFYTNGMSICNAFGDTIPNGDSLAPAIWPQILDWHEYWIVDGALILPAPGNENLYYLLHQDMEYSEEEETYISVHFFYTLVDMSTAEGEVLSKNNLLSSDTLDMGYITAVRHGNGRDWWIVRGGGDSNVFRIFLLDPTGIYLHHSQAIGPLIEKGSVGQAVFSPDGTKYARLDATTFWGPKSVKLYDFDRCSGMLSDVRETIFLEGVIPGGLAFAPNSRYLYVSVKDSLFQYDTAVEDFGNTRQLIAVWSGAFSMVPPLAAVFYVMRLAPDGKIYMATGNGTVCLHVIHNPNEAGQACNFEEMGLTLPTYNLSLPNFANYSLGAWEGSPCDTLGTVGLSEPFEKPDWSVWPNPAKAGGLWEIDFGNTEDGKRKLCLYEIDGKLLGSYAELQARTFYLSVPEIPGIYLLEIQNSVGEVRYKRLVVE